MTTTDRNRLIADHYHLAAVVTSTVLKGRDKPGWDDAHSAALEALVLAAHAFDPARGCVFNTLAWPRLIRAVQRQRMTEAARWDHETTGFNVNMGDEEPAWSPDASITHAEAVLERAQVGMVLTAEDRVAAATDEAEVEQRLSRLSPELRAEVEVVLGRREQGAGRRPEARHTLAKVEAELGRAARRPPSPPGCGMPGSQRSANWYSRLTPEQKEERRRKERERARAKVAARRAAQEMGVAA